MSNFQIPEKVKTTLYVCMGVGRYNNERITVSDLKPMDSEGWEMAVLTTHEIEIEIPGEVDLTGQLVRTLENRREALYAEFRKEVDDIDRQISEALALPAPAFDDSLPYTGDEDPAYCSRCSREFSFAELESNGGFCHFCITDADA